jgi:beta-galactosidase
MQQRLAVWFAVACVALLSAGAPQREATPALVNPALRSPLRQTLSLDGTWDFATDPAGVGEAQKWFNSNTPLPNKLPIAVPGCWEAQGVGGPGNSTTVTPERSIRPLRGSYVGTAWYRKELTLPKSWAGKQVWLKIGGVHAQGWFWVNGTYLGHLDCYCGAYKYNITDLVKAGQPVLIAAKVRNDVPSRKGLMSWIERFGGLYRSIELEATPAVLIDDAYVVGDLDQRNCTVHVKLRSDWTASSSVPSSLSPKLQIRIATLDGKPAGKATVTATLGAEPTLDLTVPVSLNPFRPWSPEEPNLYRADITLKMSGQPGDGWVERFGVRKWEVRGGSFYLNNRKYFIRGYGDDYIYPLTIASPASREVHRQHLQLAKSYGFAYVRHHTHCELPEFYDAADEVGIMVQPEMPYYGPTPSAGPKEYFKPAEDLTELYTHYRRYVSLSTYCAGNEGHLGSPIDREVYQLAKRLDPTRLALHQDGGQNRKDNSDFHQGPTVPWEAGTQDSSWPFTAHEYLNLATEEDPRLAPNYTGAILPPVKPEDFRTTLAKAGLSWDWGLATLDAGNQLQRVYQKRGLETARRDPDCGGYIYWTLIDVGSPSAQGLFNQFWQPKASTADYSRQFNSPTVVLARFSPNERILRSGDTLKVEWWISAFDAKPLRGQSLRWSLTPAGALSPSKGERAGERGPTSTVAPFDADPGEVKLIGSSEIKAPQLYAPAKLQLIAELPGTGIRNSWDLWVFPQPILVPAIGNDLGASPRLYELLKSRYDGLTEVADATAPVPELLLAEQLDSAATNALAQGKNVLLLRLPGPAPGVQLGWWAISKQAGTAIARHPAFGDFPHDTYLNELWFRLVDRTVSASDEALHQVEPLMVGRGSAGCLLHVFQARAGHGKLLASGLKLLSAQPEAQYLLDQFIRYARSSQFQPQGTLDLSAPVPSLAASPPLNGWTQTLHASETWDYASFLGEAKMAIARQTDGASQVTWRTKPLPIPLDPAKSCTLAWVAGLGYRTEPSGKFTLFLADRPLLDFDVTAKNSQWRSPDGTTTLKYTVKSANEQDSSGLMELSFPASLLQPGKPAELTVRGSPTHSRRWFGLYELDQLTP